MTSFDELRSADMSKGIVAHDIYTDPEIFALEKEFIFTKSWHYACMVHDLKNPGDFFNVMIVDQPVIIVRGQDMKLRAFYNACTHRAAMLTGERSGCAKVFKCMYHAWTFNLDGDLIAVPYEEDYPDDFKKSEYDLVPVHVDTFKDLVFVALEPTIPNLVDYLGDMVEHMGPYVEGIEPIGRNSWVYEGNWKLWHENFRDNYHPEFTHRSIHDMTPHYADRGGNWAVEPGHSVLRWIAEEPNMISYAKALQRHSGIPFDSGRKRIDQAIQGGIAESAQEVLALFPNFDLQPGPKDKMPDMKAGFIQVVTPLSATRAKVEITIYSDIDDTPERRQEALENLADSQGSWGKVSADDTEAAYRCSLGSRGRGTKHNIYTRGAEPGLGGEEASSRAEYSQREFFKVYQQYMEKGLGSDIAYEIND